MVGRTITVMVLVTACGRLGFDIDTADGPSPAQVQSTLTLPIDPGEALVDFPLLVVLDNVRANRSLMKPDASDLRFYDASGTVLAYEIEQLGSPNGAPLIAWVRVPLIVGTQTELLVDYGRANVPPRSSDSVWATAYAAVYHLVDLADATPNHHDGSWSGGAMVTVAGKIGPTQAFVGAQTDSISVPDAQDLAFTNVTVSGWIFPVTLAAASGYAAIVSRENGPSINDDFWLGVDNAGAKADAVVTTTMGAQLGTPGSAIALATWTHLAMTYDGATEVLYVNGAPIATTAVVGMLLHGSHSILLGADRNNGAAPDADFVDGRIDEVRVENVSRSHAWLAFDNASQRDAVITYGAVGP